MERMNAMTEFDTIIHSLVVVVDLL